MHIYICLPSDLYLHATLAATLPRMTSSCDDRSCAVDSSHHCTAMHVYICVCNTALWATCLRMANPVDIMTAVHNLGLHSSLRGTGVTKMPVVGFSSRGQHTSSGTCPGLSLKVNLHGTTGLSTHSQQDHGTVTVPGRWATLSDLHADQHATTQVYGSSFRNLQQAMMG